MRSIGRFEVGSIPSVPQVFQFYDEDGNPANMSGYTGFEVELLGSDNERVDLSGIEVKTDATALGRLTVVWPRRSNVFSKTGQYLARFKFSGPNAVDYSETYEIKVTNFGRIGK